MKTKVKQKTSSSIKIFLNLKYIQRAEKKKIKEQSYRQI